MARKMKLKFKHQDFQADAVEAVCGLFEGQPRAEATYRMDTGDANTLFSEGYKNEPLRISESKLLENLQKVQKIQKNGLRGSKNTSVEMLTSHAVYGDGRKATVKAPVFSIEMETGTGKTYTYIKTIYELNARFGWKKFIIVVPSVAIREGVDKTFQITAEHFKQDYGKACRFFIYNSSKLNNLDTFASDAGIQVMIVNTQAFNSNGSDNKRIDMLVESFKNRRPIDVIAETNPILIVDEPQSVLGDGKKSNATRNALGKFKPLFYLNYSATHRENFNMVYRLDAIQAYNKQLVKQISVKGIEVRNSSVSNGYIYLQNIKTFPHKSPSAVVTIEYNSKTSDGVKKITKNFEHGDDLFHHSGEIKAYENGYKISSINALENFVEFSNGVRIYLGEVLGDSGEEDLRRIQIRETILSHLEKEFSLFKRGVKTLSLFFIDEVAKYRKYDESGSAQKGLYAEIFEKEYRKAVDDFLSRLPFDEEKDYREYLRRDSEDKVHEGYFSKDKKGRAIDSKAKVKEGGVSDDVDAYDLIMKDKERLLSFDEPVRFVFSHSALREGWDNPNVFQICTLAASASEIKKRQEIGRGLRLSVNQHGERMDAERLGDDNVHDVNSLTVIANESYESFAKALQREYSEIAKSIPTKIDESLFSGITLTNDSGKNIEVGQGEAFMLVRLLGYSGVIDNTGQETSEFSDLTKEAKSEKIADVVRQMAPELVEFADNIVEIIDSVADGAKIPVPVDARKSKTLKLNQERYKSAKFQDLWRNIKRRTFYSVDFDEDDLIARCIQNINSNLSVSFTTFVVTEAYLEKIGENRNPKMRQLKGKTASIEGMSSNKTKYDLLGSVSKNVNLTRKTVAEILRRIDPLKFDLFKRNPEEFISKVSRIINDQKITAIIEKITYRKIDAEWDMYDIFEDEAIRSTAENSREAQKHLYDLVRFDSSTEKKFSEDMDVSEDVEMYVKLPKRFYIDTPVGRYNPDWAVIFRDGDEDNIYFITETKGEGNEKVALSGVSSHTGDIEKMKIACAEKHFKEISSNKVKYHAVKNLMELIDLRNS